MLKITGSTTIDELAVELGKLGIEKLEITIEASRPRASTYFVKLGRFLSHWARDSALTLADALDSALARYLHRESEKVVGPAPMPTVEELERELADVSASIRDLCAAHAQNNRQGLLPPALIRPELYARRSQIQRELVRIRRGPSEERTPSP